MNRLIEEIALNAWPALQTRLYDGWVLRFANGYTKRANSVTPVYSGRLALQDKIDHCASLFEQQDLPLIFRLPSFVENSAEINTHLQKSNYKKIDETRVLAMSFEKQYELTDGIELVSAETWLHDFHQLNKSRSDDVTHAKMLAEILVPTAYMRLVSDGQIVAAGLGVAEAGYVGLFDIVSAENQRNRGFGRKLVESLLAWGQTQQAHSSYLQVMDANAPANHLYEKIGYTEQYRYWYRLK